MDLLNSLSSQKPAEGKKETLPFAIASISPNLPNSPHSSHSLGVSLFCSIAIHLLILLLILILSSSLLSGLWHHKKPLEAAKTENKQNSTQPQKELPALFFNIGSASTQEKKIITSSKTNVPTDKTVFQSDHNSQAASEQKPTGKLPLPSQGNPHHVAITSHLLPELDSSSLEEEPSVLADTKKHNDSFLPSKPLPQPTPPTRSSLPASPKIATQTTATEATPKTTPKTAPIVGRLSSDSQHEEKEAIPIIRGNISNKGSSSVETQATPLGKYRQALFQAIKNQWDTSVDTHLDLLSVGSATISCYITSKGEVKQLHMVTNTSNDTLVEVSFKSILDASLPKMPPEVAKTLKQGQIKMEYIFTICPDMSSSNDDF